MDCLQASEIISAAHDGEPVDTALLAEAREHAQTCDECARFERVLDRVASAPGPGAPADLVARIGEIAVEVSGGIRRAAERADAPVAPVPALQRDRGRFVWLPRVVTLASAAAVLLVVVTAGGIALLNRTGQTAGDVAVNESDGDAALMEAPATEIAEDATAARSGAGAAQPSYVSLEAEVYALSGVTDTAPANLTPAGSVRSALDGDPPVERAAFHPGSDRSVLYVTGDAGEYRVFGRVVRTLGGARYGLMSATDVGSFGEWPSLPGSPPQRADGSPVFVPAGYDDLGVQVFTPPGADTADGFAIAPGTSPDDPAAGNPGWTWWEPLP